MSLSLPRSDLIASASRPDRIPTCSGRAAAMSSDAVCGQAPFCASAGRFADQQMQTSKIAKQRGPSGTVALLDHFIGTQEQSFAERNAERPGCLGIDNQ